MLRSLLWSLPFTVPAFVQSPSEVSAALEVPSVVGPSYHFGDFDADGLEDVYVVDPLGADQLFRNLGTGAFEDVTALHGLTGSSGSLMALWSDLDGDRALDLYVASAEGQGKLFQNTGQGFFVDVTESSGLEHGGAELFAQVLDYDGDACSDLLVSTEQGDLLFHNLGGGIFERAALPALARAAVIADPAQVPQELSAFDPAGAAAVASDAKGGTAHRRVARPHGLDRTAGLGAPSGAAPPLGGAATPSAGGASSLPLMAYCPPSIRDQASGNCLSASTTPTLGMLYPLSVNLNVSATGKVGVGTASPNANLHVAGIDGLLATGSFGSGTQPATGVGTRMMWYPRKAAFRAGLVSGTQWDDDNIGHYSMAMGFSTMACGAYSTAMGDATTAYGHRSTAMGRSTAAYGDGSTAMGNSTVASGVSSTALCFGTTASGVDSLATGHSTIAGSFYGTAIGAYNVGGGSPTSWILTDPLFEIGNSQLGTPRTNAMTVLKNGSTGIGTTAPDSRLHVHNGSAGSVTAFTNSVLTIENSTNNFVSLLSPDANERGFLFGEPSSNIAGSIIYNTPAVPDGLEFRTNGNQSRMSIDANGRVGLGTTAPTDALDVRGRINVDYFDENTGTTANTLRFGGSGSGEAIGSRRDFGAGSFGLDFYTSLTRRMYIAGDGKVGIGRTPTANLLEVEGNASKSSAGDWLANSDRRIKREIETIDDALDVIDRVRPVAFRYTEDYLAEHPLADKVYFNVIAQEFAEVFPDYVQPSGEGDILQVDTYPMQVYAVAAVQELHRMVDEKDARIAALEERVAVAEVTARTNDARIARLESALAALSIARR